MSVATRDRGLSKAEAERRLHDLGPPPDTSSRSTASIVAGNVFTLFNLIIGVFFILVLSLGLFADALFGMIAVVNSYIGIRQELKAKNMLDELAVLVSPRAKVYRDGEVEELLAEEVVPGDLVRVEPGDQLVADGELVESRGLTLDESMLTGESEGIRKVTGDEALSGSFCLNGSGLYEVNAVREKSYAGRVAGEAKAFRHPPSPLQDEVNRVIIACTYILIPLGILQISTLIVRDVDITEAAQTATAGLITLVPEGLVLLMSVTFAVAAMQLARRNTLIQQISATESLAAVDTVCVDKTGTLTDGNLALRAVVVRAGGDADAVQRDLARYAASSGERNRTLEVIAQRFPGEAEPVASETPFSSEWKWSALALDGGRQDSLVLGAPDVFETAERMRLPPELASRLQQEAEVGNRVLIFGHTSAELPADPAASPPPPIEPAALIVLAESLRPDAVETVAFLRSEQVDLKLISGDAKPTVTAVARAVGIPEDAGVVEGRELPEERSDLARVATENAVFCRIKPDQKKDLVRALSDAGRFTAMMGDGVNDVPALKQARMAVAMGSGSQVTKGISDVVLLDDEFARLPEAIAAGRRIARNIHRLGRLYMTKTIYAATLILLVGIPGFTFPFLPRHLTLAALLTIGIPSFVLALAPSDGPLYRGRLLRSLAAFALPAGISIAIGSILSYSLTSAFGGSVEDGRTAATTTLIVLGLCFVLLLERGPGREHIAIQSYMLAMVAGLGALFALILSIGPAREFFAMSMLTSAQWFVTLLAAALGLVLASVIWRLPAMQRLEAPDIHEDANAPKPIHFPVPSAASSAARAAGRLFRRNRSGR